MLPSLFYQKLKSRNKDDILTDADQRMDAQQVHKIRVIICLKILCVSKKILLFQTNKTRSKDIK